MLHKHNWIDLSGFQFGCQTVKRETGSNGKNTLWEIECANCGNKRVLFGKDIRRSARHGKRGCRHCSMLGRNRTHGMSQHPAYHVWRSMRDRCRLSTHQAWKNYGGRGITVCDRWRTFDTFWQDMGPTYQPGLSIDRIDNEGPYAPDNCRWATASQQAQNQRRSPRQRREKTFAPSMTSSIAALGAVLPLRD